MSFLFTPCDGLFDRDRGHVYLNGADYQEVSASEKDFGIQNFAIL